MPERCWGNVEITVERCKISVTVKKQAAPIFHFWQVDFEPMDFRQAPWKNQEKS